MHKETFITAKGAKWKHLVLNRIARSREFPMRLRIFNILKFLFNIDLVKTKTRAGVELLLDISDWVQYQIYFYGNYENKSVELFKEFSIDAECILDIGSNICQYALECAQQDTSQNKKIYAIEANPKTFTYLLNNIQLNNFKQVKAVLGAISDQHYLVDFYIPSYRNLGNTQINKLKTTVNNSYLIATYTLNSLIDSEQIVKIDLMKIDIEGHEFVVFQHLFEQQIFPKKILFEYIPEVFQDINLCIELLKVNNYVIYTIEKVIFHGQSTVPEQNLFAVYEPQLNY
jgi:FkbM family methyltransferase